jgi:hypothetical protein
MALKDAIWIYIEAERRFLNIERSSPKLNWARTLSSGSVWYQARKNSKKGGYCPWGATPEDCCSVVNQYTRREITELEARLAAKRATLVEFPR